MECGRREVRFLRSLILAVLFFLASVTVHASSRETLLYQGLLFDTAGDPITGSVLVTFRFYESDTGGAAVWEEVQSILVDEGVYTAELGSQVSFPTDLFDKDALFLGIQIEGDSEMTPRLGLFSVPWAQQAEVAVTALSLANNVVTGVNIAPSSIESSDITPGAIGATEIASSGVTAGTYSVATITVDQDGRITSASSGGASGAGSGDVTAVTAGTGLTGGGTSGDVTLNVDVGTVAGRIVQLDSSAALPAVSGANLTSLNATNISSGTLTDARLSTNVSQLGSAIESSEITDGTITSADISTTAGITDAQVSDTLTASSLVAASSVVSDAEVDNNITIDLAATATALAANGANCSAGSYALGVDASGVAEGCTADDDQPDSDAEVPDVLTIGATGSVAAAAVTGSLTGSQIDESSLVMTGLIDDDDLAASAVDGGTGGEIQDDTITNADINSSAAIAGTKISPDFGSQAVTTSGSISTTGSGTITAAGDLAAAGGFKMMIGPFQENNVAAGATRQWALGTEDNAVEDVAVPWAGSVMGVSVTCAPALGAGAGANALTVEPLIDGSATGLTAAVSASASSATATQAKDTDTFAAGATIGCRAVTTASFTPTSLECVCLVFVEM